MTIPPRHVLYKSKTEKVSFMLWELNFYSVSGLGCVTCEKEYLPKQKRKWNVYAFIWHNDAINGSFFA